MVGSLNFWDRVFLGRGRKIGWVKILGGLKIWRREILRGRKKEVSEKLAVGISGERRRSRWQPERVKWRGPGQQRGRAGGRLRQVEKQREA